MQDVQSKYMIRPQASIQAFVWLLRILVLATVTERSQAAAAFEVFDMEQSRPELIFVSAAKHFRFEMERLP
jgi:hypothetical protein